MMIVLADFSTARPNVLDLNVDDFHPAEQNVAKLQIETMRNRSFGADITVFCKTLSTP